MPEETDPVAEEKAEVQETRGIGLAKAHVYYDKDELTLVVSTCDFFEGDTLSYGVKLLTNGTEGSVISGTEEAHCGGKVAGSDLKMCSNTTTYPLGLTQSARIRITYGGVENSVDIGPHNTNAWIDWNG